jgi:hypothetical protein
MVIEVIAYVSIPMWWGTVLLQNEVGYLFFQLGQQPLRQHVVIGAPCNGGLGEEERPKHTAVGYGKENIYLQRIPFMLQCGMWVFHNPKSQIMPTNFATQVKCGFVSEHESVLETIHLQPFLQITASSEHFRNVKLVSVASQKTWRVSRSCYICICGINSLQQSQLCFHFVPFILSCPVYGIKCDTGNGKLILIM